MKKLAKLLITALFGFMLVLAALFGAAYGLKQRDTPAHMATAEQIVETLSQRWRFSDISAAFQPSVIDAIDENGVQRAFDRLRGLGHLKGVRAATVDDYQVDLDDQEGFHRRATLTFIGVFDEGEAKVTIIFVTKGGVSKVQHLNLKPVRMPPAETRRGLA